MSNNNDEEIYNFDAAFTLLRIGGLALLLFLLFVMSRIQLSSFPYGPENMKKFVNVAMRNKSR